ncbi:MAG: PLP-dependent aspartate aminotransferase family protein [Bacteroidota bacterium]
MKKLHKETACIHAKDIDNEYLGVNTPIYADSAYKYRGAKETQYPRYFNTLNNKVISQKIAKLENAEAALVFSSGMAAISTSLLSFLKNGDHAIFSKDLYGGTYNFIVKEFPKAGIEYTFVEGESIDQFSNAIKDNSKLIYVESPSNPLLRLIDLKGISNLAEKHNLLTFIDNTFATPINQNPVNLGFDIVLHSGTKYMGGHSDLCFGAVACNQSLADTIYKSAINYGGSLNAQDLYLAERSLKTLAIRVNKQSSNAMEVAESLESHPAVRRVFYPGLSSHPQHELAKEQMSGFGGMLAFELNADDESDVDKFLDSLEMIEAAVSLGGVETTICSPMQTSHIKMPKEDCYASGINEFQLRLSVGIENPEDIIGDLKAALEKVRIAETV